MIRFNQRCVLKRPRLVRNAHKQVLALALLAAALVEAQAAWSYTACGGILDWVSVNPDGRVSVNSTQAGYSAAYVCQIGGTYNGVGPDQCKAILSLLLSAQVSGKPVGWFFNDPHTCANQTAYQPLTGWYYGPIIQN